ELRERIQACLDAAEVVVVEPVPRELLQGGQLDALRTVGDELFVRPARRCDAAAQVVQLRFRDLGLEGADRGRARDLSTGHGGLRRLRGRTRTRNKPRRRKRKEKLSAGRVARA